MEGELKTFKKITLLWYLFYCSSDPAGAQMGLGTQLFQVLLKLNGNTWWGYSLTCGPMLALVLPNDD